jgi:hypothetical protein
MKKILLGLVLDASVTMASDMPTDDLLAVATQGKTEDSQFEMSKSKMEQTDGGLSDFYCNLIYGRPFYDTRTYQNGGYTWMRY